MNDLEYRRKQLLKLQEAVIDLEDLSTGVSITDLTLNDFRIDLAEYRRERAGDLEELPLGAHAVTIAADEEVPPGIVFCLEHKEAHRQSSDRYPLSPYYLVHVSHEGVVELPYLQAKQVLDLLKRQCVGRDMPELESHRSFDEKTDAGRDMTSVIELLRAAVESVSGKQEEESVASLFTPGGTVGTDGEATDLNSFEVIGFLAILPGRNG